MTKPQIAADAPYWAQAAWAGAVLDLRPDPRPLHHELAPVEWDRSSLDGSGWRMTGHSWPRPIRDPYWCDAVLLIHPPVGDPCAVVVSIKSKDRFGVAHLALALRGVRAILDKDPGEYQWPIIRAEVVRAWGRVPLVHRHLSQRSLGGHDDLDSYFRLDCLTFGVADPVEQRALASAPVEPSRLGWFLNRGWSASEIPAWAERFRETFFSSDWHTSGFSADEAGGWVDCGIYNPHALEGWRQGGWADDAIREWAFAGNQLVAAEWKQTRLGVQIARSWHEYGVLPGVAAAARRLGLLAPEVAAVQVAMQREMQERTAADSLENGMAAWLALMGAYPDLSGALVYTFIGAGLSAEEASALLSKEDFDVASLEALAALRGRPSRPS